MPLPIGVTHTTAQIPRPFRGGHPLYQARIFRVAETMPGVDVFDELLYDVLRGLKLLLAQRAVSATLAPIGRRERSGTRRRSCDR